MSGRLGSTDAVPDDRVATEACTCKSYELPVASYERSTSRLPTGTCFERGIPRLRSSESSNEEGPQNGELLRYLLGYD